MAFSLGSPLAGGNGMVYRGPLFVPGAQAAATTSTRQGPTIAQQAYGVTAGPPAGPQTAHLGTVITGVAAIVVLVFVWWSLPR